MSWSKKVIYTILAIISKLSAPKPYSFVGEPLQCMPMPGVKCPKCAQQGTETWVLQGKNCPKCGHPCRDAFTGSKSVFTRDAFIGSKSIITRDVFTGNKSIFVTIPSIIVIGLILGCIVVYGNSTSELDNLIIPSNNNLPFNK